MVRIYKTRYFSRWTSKERLSDSSLIEAIVELEGGLVEANLGGGIYKKRVAT